MLYTVAPAQVYTVTVGAGGTAGSSGGSNGGAGGATTFTGAGGTVSTLGGAGGIGCPSSGGTAGGAGGTGGTFNGGNGASGNIAGSYTQGGGGGGAAGSGALGGNAPAASSGVGGPGGTAGGGSYAGGNGGSHAQGYSSGRAGVAGAIPGGGGSGSSDYDDWGYAGGAGARGQVIVVSNPSGCPSATRVPITITVDQPTTVANAGTLPALTCNGVAQALNANNPTVGTGLWSVTSGPSTSSAQFSNPLSRTSSFTPSAGAGTYQLTWTITNGGCSSTSTINDVVTIIPLQPSTISGDAAPCNPSVKDYSVVNDANVVTYNWSFPTNWNLYQNTGTNNVTYILQGLTGAGDISVTGTNICGTSPARTLTLAPDNTPPAFTCPANISVSTDATSCDAVVTWTTPTVTDACSDFTAGSQAQTFATPGKSIFFVPAGVTSMDVEVWGAGGGGGGTSGFFGSAAASGGGGGGGYSKKTVSVTPGTYQIITVGNGGSGGASGTTGTVGESSSFGTLVIATGGAGGIRGIYGAASGAGGAGGTGTVGTTLYSGGNGSAGISGTSSGAGGSSAGTGSNGNAATTTTGGGAVAGGGAGANGSTAISVAGLTGANPGGGGGGARRGNSLINPDALGGKGGNGQVKVSWVQPGAVQTAGLASGSAFPVGTSTVTYQAVDQAGASTSCSFTVTVTDDIDPVLSATPDILACSTAPTLTAPTATDNCTVGAVTNNAPGVFPTGTTVVTWSVTDANGNTTTSNQNVTLGPLADPTSVATASSAVLATGDLLWSGNSSTNWGVNSNWYEYNGTSFVVSTSTPVNSSNVFILPSTTPGICISAINNTIISAGGSANDVFIGAGATAIINSGQNLDVNRNWTNNGTFTPDVTASVSFVGSGAQTLGGASSNEFTNLIVNKGNALTLNSPASVSGTLTMTSGNITTSPTNLLTIGTSAGAPGLLAWTDGTVLGPLKRFYSNAANASDESSIFPVGNASYNRYARVNFTTANTVNSITAHYVSGIPSVGYTGLPATVNGQLIQNYEEEGYWSIEPEVADATASYDLTLRGNNLSTPSSLGSIRIIKSVSHTTWDNTGIGTNNGASGSNSDFLISNSGMQGFSFFNIGSNDANPLPVELTNFTAICNKKNQAQLNWTTASEQNAASFVLEESRDLNYWSYVTELAAAGNSTTELNYTALDTDILNGTTYYRLIQKDLNGSEKVYGPISISCAGESNEMIVFPNPTKGDFVVEVSTSKAIPGAEIQLSDLTGKVIALNKIDLLEGKNQIQFEGNKLQMGTYIVKILSSSDFKPVKVVIN